MLTRIDHPIIAVRDLDAAVAAYGRLGFDVIRGGRNPGRGTHNALIRFGLDYLELLSIEDPDTAARVAVRGAELVRYVQRREGGLIGYVVAVADVDAVVARATASGWDPGEPVGMERLRPDGHLLRWRLLVPGAMSFRRPWPFVIEWATSDEERMTWEPPGRHANGARRVAGLVVAVRSPEAAARLYGTQLGLPLGPPHAVDCWGATRITAHLPGCPIELLAPSREGEGPLARLLADEGEGPLEVRLGVEELRTPRDLLAGRGIELIADAWSGGLRVPEAEAVGARLVFVEEVG